LFNKKKKKEEEEFQNEEKGKKDMKKRNGHRPYTCISFYPTTFYLLIYVRKEKQMIDCQCCVQE